MLNILERGTVYKEQLTGVQSRLNLFAELFGLKKLDRGRRPNAGIYGVVGEYDCSIQVTALETDWEVLPDKINPEMTFTIWCGVYRKAQPTVRKSEILRHTKFSELENSLELFLVEAEKLLEQYV